MTTTTNAMFRSDFNALSLEALTAVHGGFSFESALVSGAQWAGVGAATGAAIGAPTGAAVGGFATSPALGVGAFPGLVAARRSAARSAARPAGSTASAATSTTSCFRAPPLRRLRRAELTDA